LFITVLLPSGMSAGLYAGFLGSEIGKVE